MKEDGGWMDGEKKELSSCDISDLNEPIRPCP